MLFKSTLTEFQSDGIATLIMLIVLAILFAVLYPFFAHKLDNQKSKRRLKIRLFYTLFFIFLLALAKIWMQGFIHILAILSLVSAALVVTNKELVMNLMGWLIITWRGLFAEGDYIQLQQQEGYVHELGVLYFKLFEASKHAIHRTTGRTIKIPNGLVIGNPLINYSRQTNLLEYTQDWLLTLESDIDSAKKLIVDITRETINAYYEKTNTYSLPWIKLHNKLLAKLMDLDIHIQTHLKWDNPQGILLKLSYYCYPKDKEILDELLKIHLLDTLRQHEKIKLSGMK